MSGDRRIALGVAGLGRAFTLMLPTLAHDSRLKLTAAADPRIEACAQFRRDFDARTYGTIEELCDDANVEALYIATPHQDHARHVAIAASRGKHVLVEKPMAITLRECAEMVEATQRAKTVLVVGHSHSFNAPILRTREIVTSGIVGRIRMINAFNYTDFIYRPRRPEELRTEKGGGVVFSQGAHQIDIVRLIGGGRVRNVRAATGRWDPSRPTEGAYSALLNFEDGTFASVIYSGYGHFDSDEFSGWIGEMGIEKDRDHRRSARKAVSAAKSVEAEANLKDRGNYGGENYAQPAPQRSWHQHFGTVLASCERADLRPLPNGVAIYEDSLSRLDEVAVPRVPRVEVIDEFYEAVVYGRPPLHSGEWAMATMEVCLAVLSSAQEQRDVRLGHQVAVQDVAATQTAITDEIRK